MDRSLFIAGEMVGGFFYVEGGGRGGYHIVFRGTGGISLL